MATPPLGHRALRVFGKDFAEGNACLFILEGMQKGNRAIEGGCDGLGAGGREVN
jgi:hypothetical protein